jgi:hypothetical protein
MPRKGEFRRSEIGEKRCLMCGEWFPETGFHKDRSKPDGLDCRCKQCALVRNRTGQPTGRPKSTLIRNDQGHKECSICKEFMPVEDFGPHKATADKLEQRCKKCNTARNAARNSRSAKVFLKTLARCHKVNTIRGSARRRAMVADSCVCTQVLCDLWKEQDGRCALTERKMTHVRGQGHVFTNVSIDRIDSTVGYTRDNIRLVCRGTNIMKAAMSDDELRHWCRLILRKHKKDREVKECQVM